MTRQDGGLSLFVILFFAVSIMPSAFAVPEFIPPTPAASKLKTLNGTVFTTKYNDQVQIKGLNNIQIYGSNHTKTVYINTTLINENGTNLGTGAKVFKNETKGIWYFRTLHNGTNVSITSNSTGITISSAGAGESTTGSNIGTSGSGIFSALVGFDLQFKKLLGISPISVTSNSTNVILQLISAPFTDIHSLSGGTASLVYSNSSNKAILKTITCGSGMSCINGSGTVTLSATGDGNTNTAQIVSAGGTSIWKSRDNATQNTLYGLTAGSGIQLQVNTNDIQIKNTGMINANNLDGGTASIFATNSSNKLTGKTLTAGSGISITNGTKTITITASGGTDTNTAQIGDAGSGTSLFSSRFNATKNLLKTLRAGTNISFVTNSTDITISSSASGSGYTNINNLDGGDAKILATNSSNKATIKTMTQGSGISITNGTKTVTIASTITQGYTKLNNLDTPGTASIIATNNTLSNTQGTFKTLTQGSGITITNGSKTVTIASTVTQGYTKANNLDGGDAKIFATNSTLSNTQITAKTLTAGSGISITNGTKTITITASGSSGFTQVSHLTGGDASILFANSSNKAILKKVSGTSNNVTLSGNSTGIINWNLGSNVVVTGGSSQTINKILYHNGFGINYTKSSSSTINMGTKGGVLVVDAGSGNRTVILPTTTGNTGQLFIIVRNDSSAARTNRVMIDPVGTERIDGDLNMNLTNNQQSVWLQSTGTAWTALRQDGETNDFPTQWIKGTNFNRWYGSATVQGTTSTSGQKTNTITATPFFVNPTKAFDRIEIDVTTNKAGSTCRSAIYSDNGNGYPDKLFTASDVGTIDTGAAAGRVGSTFTQPIILKTGAYWLAVQCSSGGQILRAWTNTQIPMYLGYVSTSTASSITTGYNATFTYGAFPANFPVATVTTTTHNPSMVLVRAIG